MIHSSAPRATIHAHPRKSLPAIVRAQAVSLPWFCLFLLLGLGLGCSSQPAGPTAEQRARLYDLVANRELETAGPLIDDLLATYPDDAMLCFQKAVCLDAAEDYAACLQYLDRAQAQAPADSCDLLNRILTLRADTKLFQMQDAKQAYVDYMAAHASGIDCAPVTDYRTRQNLYYAGLSAIQFQDFAVADSIGKVLIADNPDETDGYDLRAAQFTGAGKYAQAIEVYDALLARFEGKGAFNGADYYFSRGLAHQALGDKARACQDFQNAAGRGLEEAQPMLDSFCVGVPVRIE